MLCGHYRRHGDPLPFLPRIYVPPLRSFPPTPTPAPTPLRIYYIVFLLPVSSPNFPSPLPPLFLRRRCLVKYTLGAFPNISLSLRAPPWKQKQQHRKTYTVVLMQIVVYGQWSMSLRFPCPLLS